MLTNFRRALRSAYVGARSRPLIQVIAVGTIAVSLALVGAIELAAHNAHRLADAWGRRADVLIYLEEDVTPDRAKKIADAVTQLPAVTRVAVVDAKEAHGRARRSLGEKAALLDGIEESFFPASIEVELAPGVAEVFRAHPVFAKLSAISGVEEVELLGDWTAELGRAESLFRRAGWVVGGLVAWACLFIVAATIRLAVFSRRDEIGILKLVGATDGFVRAPFLVEGAAQGAVGALFALGAIYGLYRLSAPAIGHALEAVLASAPLAFFSPWCLMWAPALGATLGLIGSWIALGRYVRV